MSPLTSRTDAARPATEPGTAPAPADYRVDWRLSLRKAERACCCPARPVIAVIMPAVPGRRHATELLLCRHHFLVSEDTLARSGAAAFDGQGMPLTPASWLAAL